MPTTTLEPQTTKALKHAPTKHAVLPHIRQRWSARAFDGQPLAEAELHTLFEAASWAPSAMNEQPWRYRYAVRGTPMFDRLWECLMPGNQPWASNAAVLVVSSGMKLYHKNNAPNHSWMHDVGLANANLLTQAISMDIFGHLIGGYDHAKADALLNIDEAAEELVCFLALGHLGAASLLEEPFRTRELTPRSRRSLEETVTAL
jgi:nitroreductase